MLDATSADLAGFRDRGGKLLLYHGWNDANNSPEATIAYYEAIESTLGLEPNPLAIRTPDFARLFLVPGMGHCGGGTGTAQFDAQRAIEDWVERGIAPDRIEAERAEGGELPRTRPLCPYPQTARYRGSGNSDRSGSFLCAE
jgi:feruloyl esterase